jgi:hypothetical protein
MEKDVGDGQLIGKRKFELCQGVSLTLSYHEVADNPYPLPNDALEKQRLDKLQTLIHNIIGANVVAPIQKKPTHIGTNLLRPDLRKSGYWNWKWRMGDGGS